MDVLSKMCTLQGTDDGCVRGDAYTCRQDDNECTVHNACNSIKNAQA
jgi:hypothetical protein